MKVSNLLTYIGCLLVLGSACKPSDKNGIETAQEDSNLYCHVPLDSLKGRKYLDTKMLSAIAGISPDPALLADTTGLLRIKGGTFDMGGDFPENTEGMAATALPQGDELPKHSVTVSDFYMDEHEVTVGEFAEFVKATGYKTTAEYDIDWEELKKQVPEGAPKPPEESLKAGAMLFQYAPEGASRDDLENWWRFTTGVNWKNPDGTSLDIDELLNSPVTQVSWYDAMGYAKWANKRLPTEAEYEYAMRGGQQNTLYPWGDETLDGAEYRGNFLQGNFPYSNSAADGFEGVAPVKSFPPNGYGLYDIAGNVWEWTLDWYGADYYKRLKEKDGTEMNPQGPDRTVEVYDARATNKVVRGGSFLCNDSWCSGFRNARRMRLSPDSGMQHVGFRCVRDVK